MDAVVPNPDAPPPADSGLRCPKCEYNLTGVAENRCPECGKAFDQQQLKAILAGAPAPIPIWDDNERNVVLRFIYICLLTWFAPARVGRLFPQRYSSRSARTFRWIVVGICVVVCGTLMALIEIMSLVNHPLERLFLPFMGILYLTEVIVCEAMIAGLLGTRFKPNEMTRPTSPGLVATESFSGVVGLFRSYVLLESAAIFAGFIAALSGHEELAPLALLAMLAIGLWWYVALTIACAIKLGSVRETFNAAMIILVALLLSAFPTGMLATVMIMIISAVASAG